MSAVAVIGATGNVGRQIVQSLIERQITTSSELTLYASEASAGKRIELSDHTWVIRDTNQADFSKVQLCLFATDSNISKTHIPKALAKNCLVVDSSSLHRLDPDVPLIVAPVNRHLVSATASRLYAMANCVSSPIAMVLAPIHRTCPIKRVVISTYQSTSGAGKAAMDELYHETKAQFDKQPYERHHFMRPIAFNVIPQVDRIMDDGFTYEEYKIIRELQKIISTDLAITATAVRVPVMIGHAVSLSLEFHHDFKLDDIMNCLHQAPGITISANDYTTPVEAAGSDNVFVGRIRRDPSTAHGLQLWLCSDNLRRGASTDVVEVADELIKQLA